MAKKVLALLKNFAIIANLNEMAGLRFNLLAGIYNLDWVKDKQLKPAYQEVIQMRYFQEMTYQEMAEQIDEPLNNIKIKLLRAKKLLAEIISGK